MEDQDVAEIVAQFDAGLKRARRRSATMDLAIALVDGKNKIMLAREANRMLQISEIGDRALRVGWRAEIKERSARENVRLNRVEIGEKASCCGRVERDDISAAQ